MIWHIFKKDCRLLWPFALVVAALNAVKAYVSLSLGYFLEPVELRFPAEILSLVAPLGVAILIAVAIHQDTIPGTSQDWLIRPIRRRDLLLAKLLFVLALVHGPLFVIDVAEGLLSGISLTSVLGAALSVSVFTFCLFSLPAFVVASLSRTLTESFITGFVLVLISLLIVTLIKAVGDMTPPLSGGGLFWIQMTLIQAFIVLVAAIVLPRQYLRRATQSSRVIVVVGIVALIFAQFLPWRM